MAKKLWRGVKRAFRALGFATNLAILALFYFVPIGLYALFARLAGRDFLDTRHGNRASFWKPRRPEPTTLDRARRQS